MLLQPVSDILLDRVRAMPGERIVDIGCGCGATALALASYIGPTGHVLGVDISEPMLARARDLTPDGAPVDFVQADATVYPFPPAAFDRLVSRFGVMFFAQPEISFSNMRKALKAGGGVTFACWREPRNNPWLIAPLQVVYKHVPKLPEVGPDDPGPFAFSREERVHRILGAAGFTAIAMERCDLSLDIAVGRGLDAAVESAMEVGPASRALQDQPDQLRKAAEADIRTMLKQYQKGESVPLGASIWIVTATKP
jgi:SAM-dependent methyltransferase